MTLNELLLQISASKATSIKVEHLAVRAGNLDRAGNYNVIKLTLGKEVIEFDDSTGSWVQST